MKRKELKIISLFLVVMAAASVDASSVPDGASEGVAEPIVIDLPVLIERVKSRNLELLLRDEGVRRALERSYQERAALLPRIGLRAEQRRTQLGQQFGALVGGADRFNNFDARVEGSLSLFDAQRYADYRIAQLAYAIEQVDYRVAVQDVLDQAVFLYFTHLRDLRNVEILEGNLAREMSLLELAQQQFSAGVAVKIDVTRADVRVATARRSLMEAKTQADDSLLQLKTLLDLELDQPVSIDRSIVAGIEAPPSLDRYGRMRQFTDGRPELERQARLLEQAQLAERAAGWQRLPTIDVFAEWGYDSTGPFNGERAEAWLAGIRATVPIWEGGRIAADRREAKAAVRQNELASKQVRNEVLRQFEFSLLEMDSRYEQIEFARDEVRLGMDEVAQARERYEEGLADNRELIDAQQSLADAELSHLRAIYLYGLSRLAFARAIGAVERVLE